MTSYQDDRRVQQVSGTEYWLPDQDGRWTVVRVNGMWNSYNQDGTYVEECSGKASANDAIRAIIGDPQ